MGNSTTPADEAITDLMPVTGPDGHTIWMSPAEAARDDVILGNGVLRPLASTGDATAPAATPVHPPSTLPSERMAGDPAPTGGAMVSATSWDDVAAFMRNLENGSAAGDITMNPGGGLVISDPGMGSTASRSVLPKERMAALKPTISMADVAEIRRIDPHNVEGWTPMRSSVLDGWRFSLQVAQFGFRFVFLAFRSPNDGGLWRIWVLRPNADDQFGHKSHMIATYVNGERIPVLCGAGGRANASLAEVRVNAGKWALYTQRRMWGQDVLLSA